MFLGGWVGGWVQPFEASARHQHNMQHNSKSLIPNISWKDTYLQVTSHLCLWHFDQVITYTHNHEATLNWKHTSDLRHD